jgi:hypothetical protein
MKKAIVTLGFSVIIIAVSVAQDAQIRADRREGIQRARIHHGRRDGQVTHGEAMALNHEQRSIHRSERRAKADGNVTRLEKRRLEKRQDRASRQIRMVRNNSINRN